MDISVDALDIAIVVGFAVLYSILDRKFKSFRMGSLYREVFWQNVLVNLLVICFFYFIVFSLI